jgi:AcrR family transcriptional regulator
MARITSEQKIATRKALIAAAAEEFARHGVAAAKIDEISLAAGLAKGTIYNYFESKEAVFAAVVESWADDIAARRHGIPARGPIRERLLALARADNDATRANTAAARVALREVLGQSPEYIFSFLPMWTELDNQVREIVETGHDRGELRTDRSTEQMARLFFTMQSGLLFEHFLFPDQITLEDVPELLVDYFFDCARPR